MEPKTHVAILLTAFIGITITLTLAIWAITSQLSGIPSAPLDYFLDNLTTIISWSFVLTLVSYPICYCMSANE